jgi:N-formylglutamate amidohydrolase
VNRALYMDERALAPHPGFTRLAADLADVFREVIAQIDGDLAPHRIAAE